MQWIGSIFLTFLFFGTLQAQQYSCNVEAEDPAMPVYAPIARAAHVTGIVRLQVDLSPELTAEIKVLDGHPMLTGRAEVFLKSRRYYWKYGAEHKACSYIAEIEYRIIEPSSDEENNFVRVTRLGLTHALIEVQPIKPTCSDCSDFRCPLDGVTESKLLTYPPMARAAHVTGDVSALVTFNRKGKVTEIADWSGPEMFRQFTEDYLRSWQLNPKSIPSYMNSCQANIFIEYLLAPAAEGPSTPRVFKADPSHILVEDHGALMVDPAIQTNKKK